MEHIIVTNEHLDIFLKYRGNDAIFIECYFGPSKREMEIMSPYIWYRIEDLLKVSRLLKDCQSEEFKEFAETFFAESCVDDEVRKRIVNIDPKDLYIK